MANLKLNILVIPTYNSKTLGITDASIYPNDPPIVSNPTIEITAPGFDLVSLPFDINQLSIYTSSDLGLTEVGEQDLPLPDGVYLLKYFIDPASINYVEKSIMRIEQLQEKFDEAFMQLDIMECNGPLKMQQKVDLNTIYFLIQGSVAAANNCAINEANTLYIQADRMLDRFINNGNCCGNSDNNFLINFNTYGNV